MNKLSQFVREGVFASGSSTFDNPVSRTCTAESARRSTGQDIRRIVFSIILGVAASGCYVEPDHPRRHEVRVEERHDEPRREHRDADDDHHHHEDHEHHD